MFNMEKAHFIVDEMLCSGCIYETNKANVIEQIQMLDKVSNNWLKRDKNFPGKTTSFINRFCDLIKIKDVFVVIRKARMEALHIKQIFLK